MRACLHQRARRATHLEHAVVPESPPALLAPVAVLEVGVLLGPLEEVAHHGVVLGAGGHVTHLRGGRDGVPVRQAPFTAPLRPHHFVHAATQRETYEHIGRRKYSTLNNIEQVKVE